MDNTTQKAIEKFDANAPGTRRDMEALIEAWVDEVIIEREGE